MYSGLSISYFRHIDRISEDNESLLKQMDTYASKLKVISMEKSEMEKDIVTFKDKLQKSETQAKKAMELEASLICIKEAEKQLETRIKTVESALDSEKRDSVEKDSKISVLSKILEKTQDCLNDEKDKSRRVEEELQLEMVKVEEENAKLTAQAKAIDGTLSSQNKDIEKFKIQEVKLKDSQTELELKNTALIEDLNELNKEMKKRGERLDMMEQSNKEKVEGLKLREIENKEKAEAANDALNELKKELDDQTEKLSEVIEEHTSLKKGSSEKIKVLENKIIELKELEKEIRSVDMETKYEEKTKKIEELEEKLKILAASKDRIIGELQHSLQSKQSELETLKLNKFNVSDEVKSLKEQLSKISSEKMKLVQDIEKKSSEILSLRDSNQELNKATAAKISECEKEKQSLEETLENKTLNLYKKIDVYKIEKERSCTENNQLKDKIEEAKQRYSILEDEVETLKKQALDEKNTLKEDIYILKKTIEELKEENSKSHSFNMSSNSNSHDIDDSRSEVMSTSTVSRVEEANRMKDIEDSFEDRYNKLKLIAIKLKKKAADQDKIIKEFQAGRNEDERTESLKEKIATLTKNFGILQQQYDEAIDKLDSSGAELKELRKDLEASISENISGKQRSEESLQQALVAKTEQNKAEERAREAEGQLRSLEVTLEQERRERQSLESSCKTNEELSARLYEKAEENTRIGETVHALKLQITQLEESLAREKDRADTAQGNLNSTRGQLTQAEADLARVNIDKDETFIKYERSVQSAESLQEQLAQRIQASDKSGTDKENKILQLERQIVALESSVQIKSQNLDNKESEFSQVKKEFENYKLRAQSVLKQSKEKVDEENTRKKKEDIFTLEKMNDALNEKLKSLSVELRTLTVERNGIQDEHDRLMSRHSQLMQESAAKEKAWRERMEQKEITIKKREEDQAGILERVHKTTEILKQTHRRELETTKASGATEIIKLKGQLDNAENEVIRIELVLHKEQEARRLAEELLGKAAETGNRFDSKLDIREIEREACEGQEVDSVSHLPPGFSAVTSPLALDQLLAQSDLPGT